MSVEPYLRRNRDDYVAMLQLALGETYYPEEHQATRWLEYYTEISVDRLRLRNRLRDAIPNDIGQIFVALSAAHQPVEWAWLLLAAAVRPLRTSEVAEWTDRSHQAVRALLARMASAGWLAAQGQTRSRRYVAGPSLVVLPLRAPGLAAALGSGEADDAGLPADG